MGWLSRLLGREEKAWGDAELSMIRDIYGSRETVSGRSVTWRTALDNTTVFRCTQVLSDGVATVPFKLMRRDPATGRRAEAADHPLSWLVSHRPNDWQSSVEFREMLMMHLCLTRNAFVFINRAPGGRILELLPVEPARVKITLRPGTTAAYAIRMEQGQPDIPVPEGAMWHLRAWSWDGTTGHEAIKAAREAIGLGLATEEQHARLHRNGLQTSGTWSVDGTLNEKQAEALQRYLQKNLAGLANAHKPLVLDRNAKWAPASMSGVDAEHLATRRFQIEEICRAMGVLPIMVGHSDKTATYASAEQMFLAHNVHSVRPWHRRWEASAAASLLTEREVREGYYFKFFDAELLRGAAKDRAEFYAKALGAGGSPAWLTPNDIRGFEDMDPHPDGDELAKPMGATANPQPADPEPEPGTSEEP